MRKPVAERDVLKAAIQLLALHPRVAWAHRFNSGAYADGGRYIRFGFVGCPDIIGQMTDGRILCLEIKRPGKKLSEDQLIWFAFAERNKINAMWCDGLGNFLAKFEIEPWSIER